MSEQIRHSSPSCTESVRVLPTLSPAPVAASSCTSGYSPTCLEPHVCRTKWTYLRPSFLHQLSLSAMHIGDNSPQHLTCTQYSSCQNRHVTHGCTFRPDTLPTIPFPFPSFLALYALSYSCFFTFLSLLRIRALNFHFPSCDANARRAV